MTSDLDSTASRASIVGKEVDRGGGAHARNRAYTFEHRTGEGRPLRGLTVLRDRQGHERGQHIFGVESGTGALQANKTSYQEPGADQKHQRSANLEGHHGYA